MKHLIKDVDNFLWDKIKSKLLKIYGLFKKKGEEQKGFAIVTSYRIPLYDKPTIMFVLPVGLSCQEVENALKKIPSISQKLFKQYKTNNKIVMFAFRYKPENKKWDMKTETDFHLRETKNPRSSF